MNTAERSALAIFLILALLSVGAVSDSDGASSDLVRFSEVNPYTSYEGFSIYNYGSSYVDLINYSVTDGEGTITFTESLELPSKTRITVVKGTDADDWFSSRENVHAYGEDGIVKTGNFSLADSGDDLRLLNGETLVDTVCYGKVSETPEGWNGDPVSVNKNRYILRTAQLDTGTAADWIKTKPGYSNLPFDQNDKIECKIMPFTFPECDGTPIYETLSEADETIYISIYQLTSLNLVALLIDLEERTGEDHVDVSILLEGDVLNYDMSKELSLMCSIVDAGGEVWLMTPGDSDISERYNYFHNKYAVVDGETVVITSENWTVANMSENKANRGWGAVVQSTEYADYMKAVWDNDRLDTFGDTIALKTEYPEISAYEGTLTYIAPDSGYSSQWYDARLVPVLSPDNSYSALKELMDGAKDYIYSEQLSLGSNYQEIEEDSPIYWMNSAAKNGVQCRFILDDSMGSNMDEAVNFINTTTLVDACTIDGGDGFNTTHNKGILIDGNITWVGSVNWTETSFMNNRETAVVIYSEEVNAYYMEYFMTDWNNNKVSDYQPPAITGTALTDGSHLFTVNEQDTSSYLWTLDGGEPTETTLPKILLDNLTPGDHTIKVTAADTNATAEYSFTVDDEEIAIDEEGGSSNGGLMAGIVAALVVIIGAIAAAFRGRGNKCQ